MIILLLILPVVFLLLIILQYYVSTTYAGNRSSYYPHTELPKVVLLGGSTTHGSGLREEYSIGYYLQQHTDQYEILNRAHSGEVIVDTIRKLEDVRKLNPRVVFWSPAYNDLTLLLLESMHNRQKLCGKGFVDFGKMLHTRLGSFFFLVFYRWYQLILRPQGVDFKKLREMSDVFRSRVEDSIKLCPQVVLLTYPSYCALTGRSMIERRLWGYGMIQNHRVANILGYWEEHKILRQLASEYNIPLVDLYQDFLKHPNISSLFIDDFHFSKHGNRIIAGVLSRYLEGLCIDTP